MLLALGLLLVLWQKGGQLSSPVWWMLYGCQLFVAVVVSVMVHNHKHVPMWRKKILNILTDNWLTFFYGFPVFAWVPTHMTNHHVHVNTNEDYTRTYRYSEQNNLLTLLSYPTISGMNQQPAVKAYYLKQWKADRKRFWLLSLQIFTLLSLTVLAFVLDWKKALIYVVIPQQLSLFAVLIFNYVQHIHADETDEYNNSRNITGWALNFFLLNNGFHTAHHLYPGLHWSKLKQRHKEIEHRIKPELNEVSFWWYIIRVYILGLFVPSFRTSNMRLLNVSNLTSSSNVNEPEKANTV